MAAAEAAEFKALAVLEYKSVFGVRLQTPCDMSDDMAKFCIELAKEHLTPCLNTWQADGDGAVAAIKEALDAKYGPSWSVIAGKHWGATITHDAKHFINFVLGKDINVTVRPVVVRRGRSQGAAGRAPASQPRWGARLAASPHRQAHTHSPTRCTRRSF
jgi:hypothetical protein